MKTLEKGIKYFELTNLPIAIGINNVLVVYDRKMATAQNGTFSHYLADVVSVTDYYPFGMQMPGRKVDSGKYRYGFNGQEKEGDITGSETHNTAEYWMYDTRLGRRWEVDPLSSLYSFQSPYAAFNNNPIFYSDPLGLEGNPTTHTVQKGETLTSIAKKHNVTTEDIIKANSTLDWGSKRRHGEQNWVFTGEKLNIPGKENTSKSDLDKTSNLVNIKPGMIIDKGSFNESSSNTKQVEIKMPETKPLPQDGVLRGVSYVNSCVEVCINQLIINGFWVAKTAAGTYTLYMPDFHGNQTRVKSDLILRNFKTKVAIGGYLVEAVLFNQAASNYYNATNDIDKNKALQSLYESGAIIIISAISAEMGLVVTSGKMIIENKETKVAINQALLKLANDQYNSRSYQAKKAEERRNPTYMVPATLKQGSRN